ncbi:MAG: DUF6111 family protein [Hyphomicrobiales bacterium]|nr:DUF6111 family protein [Hyphomicrobiales bacterium]MCY4048035.1 DUF6111 family protein [Hyphomicrobiales bacterium]MCY4052299.1 DUF6111 family protein [Hyphomicrobiales bacterium]
MLRIFLIQLGWFLLPFAAYGLYIHAIRRLFPARRKGKIGSKALVWLTASGLLLVAMSLFTFALVEGEETGKVYSPPRFERGGIVPGQFE